MLASMWQSPEKKMKGIVDDPMSSFFSQTHQSGKFLWGELPGEN